MNRQRPTDNSTRRGFLKSVSGTVLAASAAPLVLPGTRQAFANAGSPKPAKAFYNSLTDAQKDVVCLPFKSELRRRISANWSVTKPAIGDDFYSNEQRQLIHEVVKHVTSEEGYERLLRQMDDDDGGIQSYSVGVFGEPGTAGFQWILTGRHLTLRADPNHSDKVAFGGPLVYGHGEESDPKKNLYYSHTKQVNEVFRALDPNQAKLALLKQAPKETAVQIQGRVGKFSGVPVSEFSDDQKELVAKTLKTLLSPYRAADVKEAMQIIAQGRGMDSLRMAFYQQGDLGSDQIWDAWRIEGPNMVWNFRGFPHVHAYINIKVKPQT